MPCSPSGVVPVRHRPQCSSAGMYADVAVHMAAVVGLVGAVRAGEWLFTRMYPKMNFEVKLLVAFVCTVRTCKPFLIRVRSVMFFEIVLTVWWVRAVDALKGLLGNHTLSLLCGLPSAIQLMACIHYHLLEMPALVLSTDTLHHLPLTSYAHVTSLKQ